MKRVSTSILTGLALLLGCRLAMAELQPETLTVGKLPPANPHRIYLSDLGGLGHVVDGRIHLVDGDSYKYLGAIPAAMFALTALSPDSSEMYLATTYYTKLNRGKRFDQFEVYDTATLKLKSEIEIPAKHAQALPYKGTMVSTADGRFVIIQNATPASSVTVVDRKAEKFVTEIETPGCWIILPAASNARRFATLCGDGTLLTVTLDDDGQAVSQQRSAKLFDAEKDPLFVQAEHIGDSYYFVSYEGNLHQINVGGDTAVLEDKWSLVDDADRAAKWKPSGYQLTALHAPSKRFYVAMHDNAYDGSHKNPAKEIWVFDLATKQRIQRAPGSNSVAMALSKEEKPVLFTYDGMTAEFVRYDTVPELKPGARSKPVGEFAGLVQLH
ncbi:MAG: amine dehydrogenase [Gammaproteobacteria bacterium]|nr:amine dehydrogenase [Gammaproteobacteria bacterium]MCP5200068.1 amine dehydrogenase [Gammaproteobacteria bacterium]